MEEQEKKIKDLEQAVETLAKGFEQLVNNNNIIIDMIVSLDCFSKQQISEKEIN